MGRAVETRPAHCFEVLYSMIVIFSETADVHADAVEKAAGAKGSSVIRLNRDEIHRWQLEFLRGEPLVTLDGRTFGVDKLRSLFLRRLPDRETFKQLPTNAPAEAHDYISTQRYVQFSDGLGLLAELIRTINAPTAAQRAQSKSTQVAVARKLGLRTPDTYSGANPDRARQHIDRITQSGKRVCTKPIMNKFLMVGDEKRTRFTELLDDADLAELESLRECPLTIQDYIEKAYELRVAVVADRIFACKIESQKAGGSTAIDWRRYNIPKTPHSRYDLPAPVGEKLLAFHAHFGLVASSFDIVRSRDGDYVFLETNPYGQWLWIEDLTGLPITSAITDALLQ
jgi:glutathione synthase/RimK-type ligase-like ATP-grasp enzyme